MKKTHFEYVGGNIREVGNIAKMEKISAAIGLKSILSPLVGGKLGISLYIPQYF